MDKNNNLEAINLLEEDKYTFSVLRSILTKKCEFILTDNEQYIICYSYKPFPIWVWTRDDVTKEQAEKVYTILKEKSLLNGQYRFNLKYDFANFLMERARIDGIEISISLELLAYECLVPIKPTKIAKGKLYKCTERHQLLYHTVYYRSRNQVVHSSVVTFLYGFFFYFLCGQHQLFILFVNCYYYN